MFFTRLIQQNTAIQFPGQESRWQVQQSSPRSLPQWQFWRGEGLHPHPISNWTQTSNLQLISKITLTQLTQVDSILWPHVTRCGSMQSGSTTGCDNRNVHRQVMLIDMCFSCMHFVQEKNIFNITSTMLSIVSFSTLQNTQEQPPRIHHGVRGSKALRTVREDGRVAVHLLINSWHRDTLQIGCVNVKLAKHSFTVHSEA